MNAPLKLSILIATPGRIDSLRQVLACLAACKASERYEVVVIDNASEPPLTAAMLATPGLPALRILREMQRGKPHALNRALDEGVLFSVIDLGTTGDFEFGSSGPRFPSGNHFWFRRAVLGGGARFPNVWTNEAQFILGLRALGHRGVFVPEAVVGHRIQKELVDPRKFRERARRLGQEMAEFDASLSVRRRTSVLARIRSRLRPLRALAQLSGWSIAWLLAGLRSGKTRLPAQVHAIMRMANCMVRLHPPTAKARVAHISSTHNGGRPEGSAQ